MPASRKVCGFCSFNALQGGNKCMKQFPTVKNSSRWPLRDVSLHRQKCFEHLQANTKTQQKAIERKYGLRYSALVELPYFNPIRHTAIDPMHNLFLGTAKHCMELWTRNNIISKQDIEVIEERMSHLLAPHSIGRLPLKIDSGFSWFSADQWKNWTLCYSPIALRGIIPRMYLQYWLLFVKACSLLCNRYLKKENVTLADHYLCLFCQKFEVNGSHACTPNMYLHLHLKECLIDYGPLYAFLCFAFERYNGMLAVFPQIKKILNLS